MTQRRPMGIKIPFTKDAFLKRYEQLTAHESHHVLLESARGGEYSIAGIHPIAKAKGKDGMTTIHYQNEVLFKEGDPLGHLLIGFKPYKPKRTMNILTSKVERLDF